MAKNSIKVVFRTPYDESVLDGTLEVFTKPSMTEPDNSMSIPEIIAKYTRGQGLQVQVHPWQVGSASEDGIDPGDGFETENFLRFGLPVEKPDSKPDSNPDSKSDPKSDPKPEEGSE